MSVLLFSGESISYILRVKVFYIPVGDNLFHNRRLLLFGSFCNCLGFSRFFLFKFHLFSDFRSGFSFDLFGLFGSSCFLGSFLFLSCFVFLSLLYFGLCCSCGNEFLDRKFLFSNFGLGCLGWSDCFWVLVLVHLLNVFKLILNWTIVIFNYTANITPYFELNKFLTNYFQNCQSG